MFFQNITFISKPKTKEKVIFQCDENYFVNYGIYNLFSCDNHGHDVHLHLINPSEMLIEQIKNLHLSIDLSISTEKLAITDINFYKLKSYYFCSRYFISNLLFEQNLISKAYIVDADVIFNEKINFDNSIELGILYYPQYDTLWKQTGANFLYVTDKRKNFIKNIVNLYNEKIQHIPFEIINENMEKLKRANMYGLDQVCMSELITQEHNFFNLCNIENFITKNQNSKIWSLTGPWKKNPDIKKLLEKKVNRLF
jgi:hypothetical protein